ncbi:hypothetical protein GY45DRAFT_1341577 [Cubamyces sp. BRFM 1775]|nr:hypothetical protein GY45DRAFT_1341577 [Cubamyces sp. BRFM 1775]
MSIPVHSQPQDASLGSVVAPLTGPHVAADPNAVLTDAYVALTTERTRFFGALDVPEESPELWSREILLYVESAQAQFLRRKQEELTNASVWARASPAYTHLKQEYDGLQGALGQVRQQYSDVRELISSRSPTLSPYERAHLRERMRGVRSYMLLNRQILRDIRSRLSAVRLYFKVLTRPWPRFNLMVESMELHINRAALDIQFASSLHSLREIAASSHSIYEYACASISPPRGAADDGIATHLVGILKMQATLQSQILHEMQSKLGTALDPPVNLQRPIRDVSIDALVDISACCEQLRGWLERVRQTFRDNVAVELSRLRLHYNQVCPMAGGVP